MRKVILLKLKNDNEWIPQVKYKYKKVCLPNFCELYCVYKRNETFVLLIDNKKILETYSLSQIDDHIKGMYK